MEKKGRLLIVAEMNVFNKTGLSVVCACPYGFDRRRSMCQGCLVALNAEARKLRVGVDFFRMSPSSPLYWCPSIKSVCVYPIREDVSCDVSLWSCNVPLFKWVLNPVGVEMAKKRCRKRRKAHKL